MKEKISKLMSFVYTFVLSRKKNGRDIRNRQYLLIVAGHMGNALLITDGLMELKKHCEKNGIQLSIACDPYMWKTLNNLDDLSGITYLDGLLSDNARFFIRNLVEMHKKVKGLAFEKIITSLPINNVDHFLGITIPCRENWCIKDDIERKRSIRTLGFGFIERGYSNLISVPIDLHETMRYKKLFTGVGVGDYKTSIHDMRHILRSQNSQLIPDSKYVTVALDSMNPNRRWKLEKFSALIQHLLDRYPYDIILTGTNIDEEAFEKTIWNRYGENQRVINLIGKTGFYEWLYILSRAEFHIGVDSGSIHFATCIGVQAYCITGVWDAHRVFPYNCEEVPEGLHEPICIYRSDVDYTKLPCYACKVKGTEFGTGNKKCKTMCSSGEPCECLNMVTPEDVMKCIDAHYMKS